jgi:hypothetical protein
MTQRILAVLIIVLALGLPALAQEGNEMVRYHNRVDSVTAQVSDDNTLQIVVSGVLPDGCRAETTVATSRVNNVWFVDLYRDWPANQPCTRALLPFESVVDATELLTLDAEAMLPHLMVINGNPYEINRAQIEPMPDSSTAPLVPPIFTPLARAEVIPETITVVHNEAGQYDLRLAGNMNDGCQMLVARAYPLWNDESRIVVEAWSAFNIAAMCTLALVPFDVALANTSDTVAQDIVVNGIVVTPDKSLSVNTQTFIFNQMVVETAETAILESFPPQIGLTVNGIRDGCEQPIQVVAQPAQERRIPVLVVRVMPENTPCTMIARPYSVTATLPTTGLMAGTTYTLSINNTLDIEVSW